MATGKKIIKELKLSDTADTLARWIVHYLAGQIKEAERASAKNRPALLADCFQTILALWQHRHEMPDGTRPFQNMEPILRALESLDPANKHNRYFPPARPSQTRSDESKETQAWLELADGIDDSARVLIRHCLANAAASAVDKSEEWVRHAEEAGYTVADLPILKIIIGEKDLSDTTNPDEVQRKHLEERAGKLRAFVERATSVLKDYEKQLGAKSESTAESVRKRRKPVLDPRLAKQKTLVIEDRRPRKAKSAKRTAKK